MKIERCELPVGFRRQDYINLAEWDGAPRNHLLDPLLDSLEQKIGRAPAADRRALRDYEGIWRWFGAPRLNGFALDEGAGDHEGDRGLPQAVLGRGLEATHRSNETPSLLILAAREWPEVRDSRDPRRLQRFELHFAGTYYAEEAHELRQAIEAAEGDAAKPCISRGRRLSNPGSAFVISMRRPR